MQLAAGDIIDGRFEVEGLVGEGGLAEVYRVRHRALGRVMALKLLTWRKKSLMERLVLEGRIQAQLEHPNIVSVIDLVHHDGQVGLLMEYVDADNLHDHIQRVGATPQGEALQLLAPVLSAVHAAHSVGITHRDLKPGNIMLARAGSGIVPKVADFGIAKVVQEATSDLGYHTRAGSAMGTPGYLAPEQVRDASTIDGRADVFALAAIAYEVLTGRCPFADEEGYVETTATATREPVPVQERVEVTPCVVEALQEAFVKDPEQRTATVYAFAEKLLHSRPDLLAAFRAHTVKPLDLDSLESAEETTGRMVAIARASAGTDAPPPTIAPVPSSQATTEGVAPMVVGGWVAAGVLGTLLLLTLGLGVVGTLYVVSQGADNEASAAGSPAAAAPAPTTPPPTPEPPPPMAGQGAMEEPEVHEPRVDEPQVEQPASAAVAPRPAKPAPPAPEPAAPPPAVAAAPAPDEGSDVEEPEEPVVIEVPKVAPAAEAPPPPVPEPVAAPSYPNVDGEWSGKAGGQRMALELDRSGGQLSGTFTLYAGTQVRTESISGTVTPSGDLSFQAGDLSFSGRVDAGALTGMYMRQGAKKTLRWSASQ